MSKTKILSHLILFCLVGLFAFPSICFCNQTQYDLKIEFGKKLKSLEGEVSITFTSPSDKSLAEIYLLLYPNSLKKKSIYLNDVNFKWMFPDNFDAASMDIKSIKVGDSDLKFNFVNSKDYLPKTLVKVKLQEALDVDKSVTLKIIYTVKIPKKFGPFGRYRKRMLLNGGSYPYLPMFSKSKGWIFDSNPPKASFKAKIKTKKPLLINGKLYNPRDDEVMFEIEQDYLSVLYRPGIQSETFGHEDSKIKTYLFKGERLLKKEINLDIQSFLEFVNSQEELSKIPFKINIAQAYLRDRLIQPADGVLYISDRLYKVLPALRNYHSVEVIRGLFNLLIRNIVRKKESASNYDWVTNTVAWHYTEKYIKDYHAKVKRDARELKIVRVFSFLPQLDQVIHAPQFSFTSIFYNKIYAYDIFRTDILDYNNKLSSKRVVFEKIKDKYSQLEAFPMFYKSYLSNEIPFIDFTEQTFGKALQLFDVWLGNYPRVNYELKDVIRKKEKDGYTNTVLLGKQSSVEIDELVEIYFEEWKGQKHLVKWDPSLKNELVLKTKERLKAVHIDPRNRLIETRKGDNRTPALYKWVFTSLIFGLDVTGFSPDISFSTQFRKLYGSYNRYNLSGYRSVASYGIGLGYTRLFGRLLDSLRFSHGLALSYRLDGVNNDFRVAVFTPEDPVLNSKEVIINTSGYSTSLLFQYFFGSQYSYTNPKVGMGMTLFFELATSKLGGDYDFYKAGVSSAGVIPFDQNNLLAWRVLFGVSGKDGIPSQRQYYLGGMNYMKGFPSGEISRVGRNRLLLQAEYRVYLIKDIDINIFSLIRVRDIMGVFFADAGRVSGTITEYAENKAIGKYYSLNPLHLLNFKRYDADFGCGIRFFYDMLGVRETIIGFDVAKSATYFGDYGLRYYITFQHYF